MSRPSLRLLSLWCGLAWLLAMAGCSSLPTIVPDLARPAGPPIQLEGARGQLSAAQSKAVLTRLRDRGVPTDIFERHLALEEAIVGSPLTTGNEVVLLQDGPATYQAMFAAIQGAQDHINMETYILDDDEVGQRFAQALIDKQLQGVQVNLIRDSVGTLGTPAAFFQRLQDGGVKLLESAWPDLTRADSDQEGQTHCQCRVAPHHAPVGTTGHSGHRCREVPLSMIKTQRVTKPCSTSDDGTHVEPV